MAKPDPFKRAAELWAERVQLANTPKTVPGWTPQPKQEQAWKLAQVVDELLYGGAAGGGKSFFSGAYAVWFAQEFPGAHIGIVRRTLPMLKQTHGQDTLPVFTEGLADHNRTESTWKFKNKSVIRFIALDHDGDEQNYKSAQFDLLIFEEVTEQTEKAYTYMLSRLRSARCHRVHSIATANPEGKGFAWVRRRFVTPLPEDLGPEQDKPRPGEVWRAPIMGENGVVEDWGPTRCFLPATIEDNFALMKSDPGYILKLKQNPDKRMVRALLYGDWEAMDKVPGALWSHTVINKCFAASRPDLAKIVVAVDPAVTFTDTSDHTGIVVAGRTRGRPPKDLRTYAVLADLSLKAAPEYWSRVVVQAYIDYEADAIIYEKNQGHDLVRDSIRHAAEAMRKEGLLRNMPSIRGVNAKRGKALRATPIAVLYNEDRVQHVGKFSKLEEQMTTWTPDDKDSPDRLDAMVYALLYLDEQDGYAVGV